MSTRATYTIESEFSTITIYIHHDGYPQGAADYFYNMIKSKHSGGFAEKFLTANDKAVLTGNHEMHGDTEWHYHLKIDGTIDIHERIDYTDEWSTTTSRIDQFVNKHIHVTDETPVVYYKNEYSKVANYKTSYDLLCEAIEKINHYIQHPKFIENSKQSIKEAIRFLIMIDISYTESGSNFNKDGISIMPIINCLLEQFNHAENMLESLKDCKVHLDASTTEKDVKQWQDITNKTKGLILDCFKGINILPLSKVR